MKINLFLGCWQSQTNLIQVGTKITPLKKVTRSGIKVDVPGNKNRNPQDELEELQIPVLCRVTNIISLEVV
jgi:hypothetical protein